MRIAPATSLAERITGVLWLGTGGILGSLILFMSTLVYFQGVDNAEAARECCLMLCCGVFWFGNAAMGFFLLLGKRWARVYTLAVASGFAVMGFLNATLATSWFPAGLRPAFISIGQPVVAMLFPFPRLFCWALAGFGLIAVCALLWPRRESATNPG